MKTLSTIFVLTIFCSTVHSQEPPATKIRESVLTVNRAGTKEAFNDIYQRLINDNKTALPYGRAILTTYPATSWVTLELGEDKLPPPKEISVCDFVADYAKPAARQDWTTLKAPLSVENLLERFSIKEFAFLHAFENESVSKHSMTAVENDRVIKRDNRNSPIVSLASESPKPLVDFRLLGWTQDHQWRFPTNFDQWMKILSFCEPFSSEPIGEGKFRLSLLHKQETRETLWVLEVEDAKPCKLRSVVQYRVVKSTEDKLWILQTKMFQSQFTYSQSKLTRIRYMDTHSANQVEFQFPEDWAFDDGVFGSRDFTANGEELTFSPGLKAELDAKFGK